MPMNRVQFQEGLKRYGTEELREAALVRHSPARPHQGLFRRRPEPG